MNALVRLRIATVAVLGNHDYESGHAPELMKMMTDQGVKVLDGTAYERDGVGFAGAKGFRRRLRTRRTHRFRRARGQGLRAGGHR